MAPFVIDMAEQGVRKKGSGFRHVIALTEEEAKAEMAEEEPKQKESDAKMEKLQAARRAEEVRRCRQEWLRCRGNRELTQARY